jgi:hypothetical protein
MVPSPALPLVSDRNLAIELTHGHGRSIIYAAGTFASIDGEDRLGSKTMQALDYHVSQSRSSAWPDMGLLIMLPIISAGFAFASAINWIDEPFGFVRLRDVMLFGGAPVVALGSATVWCLVARKRRLPWPILIVILSCFALILYWSVNSLLPYFREPWNT